MRVLRFNNGRLWWSPFCLASHVTKKEKCLFTVEDLLFTFENRSDQYDSIVNGKYFNKFHTLICMEMADTYNSMIVRE